MLVEIASLITILVGVSTLLVAIYKACKHMAWLTDSINSLIKTAVPLAACRQWRHSVCPCIKDKKNKRVFRR